MQESGANEPGRRAASWWAGFSLIKYQIELPKPPNKMCQQCGRLRQICTGQILGHIVCLPACLPRVLFAVFLPAFVLLFAASIRLGLVWFGFRFRKRPRIEWRWLKLNGFINGKCPAAIVWFNSNLAKANVNANADNDNQITNEQTPNVCQKHIHTHRISARVNICGCWRLVNFSGKSCQSKAQNKNNKNLTKYDDPRAPEATQSAPLHFAVSVIKIWEILKARTVWMTRVPGGSVYVLCRVACEWAEVGGEGPATMVL